MTIICKKCHSDHIKKNGIVFGVQRYKCHNCGCQFLETAFSNREATVKATAISLCHLGVSQNQTAKILRTTPTTIARWLHKMPTTVPFQFKSESKTQEVEESTLRNYIKNLYIQNKENFIVVKNQFKSGHEIDIIVKNKNPKKNSRKNLTVCAFGDSILQGVVHDAQCHKYHILKENFVNLSKSTLNVLWKNYAKHGSTVTDGKRAFAAHLDQIRHSDYILFSFGGNDCNFNWDKISDNPRQKHYPKLSVEDFHEKYIHLIKSAQKQGKTPILFSLPPVHSELFFKNVILGRNKGHILEFLNHDIGAIYRWHSMYNLEVFKIARETDIPIIDISSCFLSHPDYSEFMCDDGVHPNQQGHMLIAKSIQEFYRHYFPQQVDL